MVSEAVRYMTNTEGFYDWYKEWKRCNCFECPFGGHHTGDIKDQGFCLAEQMNKILSQKRRVQLYIAIDYHKNQKGNVCFLKENLRDQSIE